MAIARSMIRLKSPSRIKRRTIALPKGLTVRQAWHACIRKAKHDFRGMKYDARTGKAIVI